MVKGQKVWMYKALARGYVGVVRVGVMLFITTYPEANLGLCDESQRYQLIANHL